MNPYKIIYNYYPAGTLRDILVTHSKCVASKALDIADSLELEIDRDFVFEAAMLHDIGIFRTDAPSIHCYGSLPYICHGIEGRQILDEEGYPRHALVCERHTGAGITVGDNGPEPASAAPRYVSGLARGETDMLRRQVLFQITQSHRGETGGENHRPDGGPRSRHPGALHADAPPLLP